MKNKQKRKLSYNDQQITKTKKSRLIPRTNKKKLKTKQILKHQSVDQRKTLAGVANKTKPNKKKVTQTKQGKNNAARTNNQKKTKQKKG